MASSRMVRTRYSGSLSPSGRAITSVGARRDEAKNSHTDSIEAEGGLLQYPVRRASWKAPGLQRTDC